MIAHRTANHPSHRSKAHFPQNLYSHPLRLFAGLQLRLRKIWLLPITLLSHLGAACTPLPAAVAIETICTVTDGDTIRCGDERIGLLGIDAPEKPVHCRRGRQCAPSYPVASTESLEHAFQNGPLSIVRMGEDRYGRTLPLVRAGETDQSCHQLREGQAICGTLGRSERCRANLGRCQNLISQGITFVRKNPVNAGEVSCFLQGHRPPIRFA